MRLSCRRSVPEQGTIFLRCSRSIIRLHLMVAPRSRSASAPPSVLWPPRIPAADRLMCLDVPSILTCEVTNGIGTPWNIKRSWP
jgi:hypothetical protein